MNKIAMMLSTGVLAAGVAGVGFSEGLQTYPQNAVLTCLNNVSTSGAPAYLDMTPADASKPVITPYQSCAQALNVVVNEHYAIGNVVAESGAVIYVLVQTQP